MTVTAPPQKKPFIFLFTGDEFVRRNKIGFFLSELIPDSLRATNLSRFHADDLDWSRLMAHSATPSLMGGAQVFWISEADQLTKDDWQVFESYCSKPARESYFIFEADKLAGSHVLVKLAKRFGRHVHFPNQSLEGGLEVWRAKLKQFAKTITPSAWQILEERLGGAPRLMDTALDQLILYADGPTIDETAVRGLSSEFLRYEPFDLTEALARKDISRALRIFHFFYDVSGEITSIVGLIHWQLKRIWQAKKILAAGGRQDEVRAVLRIPPFRLTAFLNQVERFEREGVERLLKALWQIDWNAKRGASEEAVAMEMFLASVS